MECTFLSEDLSCATDMPSCSPLTAPSSRSERRAAAPEDTAEAGATLQGPKTRGSEAAWLYKMRLRECVATENIKLMIYFMSFPSSYSSLFLFCVLLMKRFFYVPWYLHVRSTCQWICVEHDKIEFLLKGDGTHCWLLKPRGAARHPSAPQND